MIISSRKNPAVSFYRELNRERKTRERERLFTVEGVKLCTEALRAGLTITSAMVTETAAKKYPDAFGEISAEFEPVIITVKHGGERPKWHEPLSLVLGDGRRFRLEFDCQHCQMNIYAS